MDGAGSVVGFKLTPALLSACLGIFSSLIRRIKSISSTHGFRLTATIFLILFVSCSISVKAKTFTYPDLNFQCTTPDGWNCDHKIGDVVHAVNPAKDKFFCLKVYKYTLSRTQMQDQEKAMMARFRHAGYTGSPRKPSKLRGISFDTFTFAEQTSTQTLRVDEYVGCFQGFIYQLELSMYDGTPSADTELKSIVDSFDFINHDGLPSPNAPSGERD